MNPTLRGVPLGRRSPLKRGPFSTPNHKANLERLGGAAFKYDKKLDVDENGFPYVIEGAFSYDPDEEQERVLIVGANFASSPDLTLKIGWRTTDAILEERFAGEDKPISIFLHIVHPRLTFTDLGKTQIALPSKMAADLRRVIEKITKDWYEEQRRELKDAKAALRRRDTLERTQNRKMTIKESVYGHLPAAYEKASGGYGARSHQIFYQLRPLVQPDTGRESLDSQYIEQTLIPDFLAENPEITADWVVLYDDRGNLHEPHTGKIIGLGTKNVRDYCGGWGSPIAHSLELIPPSVTTRGPAGRYGAILFCEKEGFTEIFQAAMLPERFDIALASTKGTSVTAAREVVELAARLGIPVFCLHDFDYNGFEIYATLHQDTRRYQFQHRPKVIDIGLRLETLKRLGLLSEDWVFEKSGLRENLRKYGAAEDEIAFLIRREDKVGKKTRTAGKRVELNAMTSPQIIELVETALIAHGVQKVIPDQQTLAEVYRKGIAHRRARKAIEEAIRVAESELGEILIPADLRQKIAGHQTANPTDSWEDALWFIIAQSEEARYLQ